jgi:hypothetical protein
MSVVDLSFRHKLAVGAALAFAVVAAPTAAWADHCVNVSRGAGNATPWETQRGRWTYIAPDVGAFWVFDTPDNFHGGNADALLEGSKACNGSRLMGQTKGVISIDALNGIWSEDCVNAAMVDAGLAP